MSARTRIVAIVVGVAVTAVAIAVGAAVLQSSDEGHAEARAPQLPEGAPPLLLDLGVREDEAARALRRAAELYEEGDRARAAELFARQGSVEGDVGLALAAWPRGTVATLERLAETNPRSAFVRLELGLARLWSGDREGADDAWREARSVEPDSLSAVRAGDLLHPNSPRGLPTFVPSFEPPDLDGLSPAEQLDRLRQGAAGGGVREKLLYGVALQRLGKPVSARRVYDAAADLDPGAVEPKVAAAVARFEKGEPERAFALLGPLSREHPRSPTVRFHLGLLLLWLGEVEEARPQLERARSIDPQGPLAAEAERFLDRLNGIGTD